MKLVLCSKLREFLETLLRAIPLLGVFTCGVILYIWGLAKRGSCLTCWRLQILRGLWHPRYSRSYDCNDKELILKLRKFLETLLKAIPPLGVFARGVILYIWGLAKRGIYLDMLAATNLSRHLASTKLRSYDCNDKEIILELRKFLESLLRAIPLLGVFAHGIILYIQGLANGGIHLNVVAATNLSRPSGRSHQIESLFKNI